MKTLTIRRLNAQGEGVAEFDGRDVLAPFTLPSEIVRAEIDGDRAQVLDVVEAHPDRCAPRCDHYGDCGGCALQHAGEESYLAFKRQAVVDALTARGLSLQVAPVVPCPPRSRRRAAFAAARTPEGIVLGFHGRRQHRIVGIRDCPVLVPAIEAALPGLGALAALAVPRKDAIGVLVTAARTGLDVALTGVDPKLPADQRQKLLGAATTLGLARLSINGETIIERTAPLIRVGEAWLAPPPGGFLQAVEAAQGEMTRRVLEGVGDARRVADLFAGSGAFTLALAARASLHAVESDAPALSALEKAARATPALRPVTTERRDLFRRPLTAEELARFDAVVIDPPRPGAEDQCRQLARSKVRRIVMVSCNAATFARDMKVLLEAGFKAGVVIPIDQFLWSPHIEIIATVSR